MDRVREQLARHPGRVVYPSFDPDRPQEPWVPIPENREYWKRTQPRKATMTTVQKGWPTEPVKADPLCRCSRCEQRRAVMARPVLVNHFPDRDEWLYRKGLQDALPEPWRWPWRQGERRYWV